jgi:hypothetical protein
VVKAVAATEVEADLVVAQYWRNSLLRVESSPTRSVRARSSGLRPAADRKALTTSRATEFQSGYTSWARATALAKIVADDRETRTALGALGAQEESDGERDGGERVAGVVDQVSQQRGTVGRDVDRALGNGGEPQEEE